MLNALEDVYFHLLQSWSHDLESLSDLNQSYETTKSTIPLTEILAEYS